MTDKDKEIQKRANICARKNGYGIATTIIFDPKAKEDYVLEHTSYGYRKNTTGEYVSNKYLNNFGWKNTYYQNAKTTVVLALEKKN